MSHVAWLGTGLLGSGFVEALLARGEAVTVWNRTASKAHALEAKGAKVAATPADAVRGAERVHLCLSDDAAVASVLAAMRPGLGKDVPIIDHTTVSPDGARARQERLHNEGVPFLACPVFMGPAAARNAQGTMLCAGPPELVARMTDVLAKMTGELVPMGEDAARPATFKLMGNALILSIAGVMADVFAIGVHNGITPEEANALMARFPVGNIIAGRSGRMSQGDYVASFELSMAKKDVALMVRAAGDVGLATLPSLLERMSALVERGHGRDDIGVLSIDSVPKKR